MTAETQTLTFGPEWLRALSSGGSVISPPLSPALPKYKLADYRYGREEMLALYIKDNKVPSDLLDKEFLPILKEEPLLPLALVPFTEEEQRNFSMSVNSAAVLRLMGRGTGGGGGTVVGAPRGRSSSRGRGRGRGESGFYQRSFDEVESGFGRGAREMHRSQSWEERGDRRFEKPARKEPVRPPFEEGIAAPAGRKHEFVRSETGSWRSLREELNGEEEEGGGVWRTAAPRRDGERWRAHSPDGARGPGWREHPDRRRRFDFDFRERDDERGHRRTRSGSGSAEDERDCLPEWCLEDAEDETGTFDSSGAFLPSKVQKESIPEEQELDFRPSLDGEEHSDSDGSNFEDAKEKEVVQVPEQSSETSKNDSFGEGQVTNPSEMEHRTPSPAKKTETKADSPVQNTTPPMASSIGQEAKLHTNLSAPAPPTHKEESVSPGSRGSLESTAPSISHSPSAFSQSSGPQQVKDPQQGPAVHSPLIKSEISSGPSPPSVCAAPGMGTLVSEPDEDDGLEHLEQQAQQMVAYLQDGALDDERLTGKAPDHRVKGHSPENQQKWYYKDPQGEIQGPFSNREMAEWYQAGYFPITLLLRRVCDETFQPLGDIIKLWGRVPFITPPAPRLGELGPEHIGRHQEMTALYQLQQLHYQQFLIQQQYTQVMAQQQKAALSSQQQQQLALLLQQFQTLKMRISEQPVVPPLPRAMSVPDNTSLWELQTAAPPPSLWEGSSVWDLPIESVSQGATREQLEKAKAAKIEQERREAELRAKQEEEEQRRRLEEEERKRKEELELARRKQEEALRRQREQELALRRQIEEEERKREDERRLLEERRRQEEERRRQEEEKRRLEEERKRLEEERKRKEEEKKREEEEKRKREELRKQEEAAKWAREEEEAARRLMEETRLRQEEEELKKREEAQRQKELQRQRQQQQEALRRLQQLQQQQQLAQMKLPSSSTWGQQVNSGGASQSTLSLAEIQKLEEERERQNQEEQRRQHQELRSVQQQQQQQQQQQKTPGWGNVVKPTVNTKSLVEIQQEEARQMQKMHQQAGRGRPANVTLPPAPTPVPNPVNSVSSSGSSVWGNLNNNMSPQWSPDSVSSIWSSPEIKTSTGFWDDAVKVVAPRNAVNKNKSNSSKSSGVNSRQSKKVEQEEKLVRLFQGAAKCADGFNQWCEQTLHALSTAHSLDVPTFVSFLREVESAYEVHDYVRAYLGDTPEAKDFSKQFLERRNKQKTVPQKPQQDSAWPVFQTSPNNLQQTTLETAQSAGRKKKKQKMVRADPSLLGFSVNASSERLNMGEIETLEDY
ncbi:GRB10-interacting GYF protein 2 isoform X2 [Bufo gargarizans]|uniref:GRB10-interacting GYF protein 2 isoform X2 n=1 Tax=Bufo gargarizans TaxID=30331 RepID=UPI001CF3CD66|nr:GRB10-interacting GYF protein 2 isoform X2 [Bufo gargarizans]